MTAEIAILNKVAVALAADSAVTVSGRDIKIYNSANKLFALSKYHPVAIMIYGGADFMGIPWETVIKMFRRQLADAECDTLDGYADQFIRYITNELIGSISDYEKRNFIANIAYSYLGYVENLITDQCREQLRQDAHSCGYRAKRLADAVVNEEYRRWVAADYSSGYDDESCRKIVAGYRDIIEKQVQSYFSEKELYKKTYDLLVRIVALVAVKDVPTPAQSGVVIAGFGHQDIFPALRSYLVDGIILDRVKYKQDERVDIKSTMLASIIPFAQREVVNAFMEGIDPVYRLDQYVWLSDIMRELPERIAGKLPHIVGTDRQGLVDVMTDAFDELVKDFTSTFDDYRKEHFWLPIVSRVGDMPKEELAALAEALVNLTALKRKVSDELETVGGPIDVAVVSKGDGLIWIKRKHYFTPEMNHHFIANYFRIGL